jgi:hypothetical protein
VGHGVLLVFGAPCQLRSLAGQEHGRTIPLAVIRQPAMAHCGEPLTQSSPIRYAVTLWLEAADAIRSTEAARVHNAAWRRGCDMAIVGASAAAGRMRRFGVLAWGRSAIAARHAGIYAHEQMNRVARVE